MKNKYYRRTKITERKLKEIVQYFAEDLDVTRASRISGIGRKAVNRVYNKLRFRILELLEKQDKFSGEVEVDESYFGARRVRGKRGRGARGKVPVIGLLKRNGKVYTKIIRKCTKAEIVPVIRGKILEESTVYTDGWKSYDGLVLNGYKHYRVYHSKDEFVRGRSHVNGIESFWSYAKRRLAKFNGVFKNRFYLHLKECEFRWNNKDAKIYKFLIRELRQKPL